MFRQPTGGCCGYFCGNYFQPLYYLSCLKNWQRQSHITFLSKKIFFLWDLQRTMWICIGGGIKTGCVKSTEHIERHAAVMSHPMTNVCSYSFLSW